MSRIWLPGFPSWNPPSFFLPYTGTITESPAFSGKGLQRISHFLQTNLAQLSFPHQWKSPVSVCVALVHGDAKKAAQLSPQWKAHTLFHTSLYHGLLYSSLCLMQKALLWFTENTHTIRCVKQCGELGQWNGRTLKWSSNVNKSQAEHLLRTGKVHLSLHWCYLNKVNENMVTVWMKLDEK